MDIVWRILFCCVLSFLMLPWSVAGEGVARTTATACPNIADHQRLLEEILTGNYAYELPDQCVTLPPGTAIRGPLERTRARFGDGEAHFVRIETPDGRQLWTLDSWVKFDRDRVDRPTILSSEAAAQIRRTYDVLTEIESAGRAMEDLRDTGDRDKLIACGQQMRGHQDDLKQLQQQLDQIQTPYGPHLRATAIELDSCVSCREDALQHCDGAAQVLDRVAITLGPAPGSNEAPMLVWFAGVTSPKLIENTKARPRYPKLARKASVAGKVILEAVIQTDGAVGELRVLREPRANLGFGDAAIEAVRQWRYQPAKQNGKPVAVYFTIVLEFVLKD